VATAELVILGFSVARTVDWALGAPHLGYRKDGALRYAGKVGAVSLRSAHDQAERFAKLAATIPVLTRWTSLSTRTSTRILNRSRLFHRYYRPSAHTSALQPRAATTIKRAEIPVLHPDVSTTGRSTRYRSRYALAAPCIGAPDVHVSLILPCSRCNLSCDFHPCDLRP
jgi:hypothetical protein